MSAELHALLARASHDIEGAAPALDGGRLGLVRSAARRRRRARHTAESFVSVGAAGVLGVGLWFGLGQPILEPVVPVVTPTVAPTPTPAPTPPPSPTESPTPTGPPTRAESIDDATVLARLRAPRTGEVWLTPTLVEDVPELRGGEGLPAPAYLVGTRGDAKIYVRVEGFYVDYVGALFEVDGQGARLIACPSARAVDMCVDEASFYEGPGVVRDVDTFYDSLTLPESIDLGDGFTVTTTSTVRSPYFFRAYGDASPITTNEFRQRVLRDLGHVVVVARVTESKIAGLTTLTYGYTTPFGSFVALDSRDVPAGEYGRIRWDDGVVRAEPDSPDDEDITGVDTVAPGAGACTDTTFSQPEGFVEGQWRPAGTAPGGHRVYVPTDGGNPLSRAIRSWHEENSWTVSDLGDEDPAADEHGILHGAAAGYLYTTDASFLAANALFAVRGPAGEWLLGMRSDAQNAVYECV